MGFFKSKTKDSQDETDSVAKQSKSLFKSKTKESQDEAESVVKQSKSGLFSKLRKSKKQQEEVPVEEDPVENDMEAVSEDVDESDDDNGDDEYLEVRDEEELKKEQEILEKQEDFVEERRSNFKASEVRTNDVNYHEAVSNDRPTAKQSVTQGGMRYDWIDIETVAAVKVQAAFRGAQCREDMMEKGLTTASMRNRMRERSANHHVNPDKIASEDVPFFARFCGIGLLFGEADEGLTDYEKEKLRKEDEKNERKQKQLAREETLRSNYRKQRKMNAKETVEVTDE